MKRPSLFTTYGMDQLTITRNTRAVIAGFLVLMLCATCDDDEETSPFVGAYAVTETDKYQEEDNYSVGIKKSGDGYQITNLGDVMNVPVNVNIEGKSLVIPAQTFVGKSMTIVVNGHGTLDDDKGGLQLNYSINTGNSIILAHTCVATKQP